jgi:predicted XRE-type DNA-binding protein/DNA-binding transcriptional regulator YiaG
MKSHSPRFTSVWDALAGTPEQAANLRARADLMRQIAATIADRGWTQAEAARTGRVTQPRINDLLRGRISRFSLDALVNIAAALGDNVKHDVGPVAGRRLRKATHGGPRGGNRVPPVTEVRERTGLSPVRFAALFGVSVRTLHEWELGRREPSGAARTLLRVAARNPGALVELS